MLLLLNIGRRPWLNGQAQLLRIFCLIILGTTCICGSTLADESRWFTGTWSAETAFAQVNITCRRKYHCNPSEPILHTAEKKMIATPADSVWGVCSAGSGPANSCNVCLTNKPKKKCLWLLK